MKNPPNFYDGFMADNVICQQWPMFEVQAPLKNHLVHHHKSLLQDGSEMPLGWTLKVEVM